MKTTKLVLATAMASLFAFSGFSGTNAIPLKIVVKDRASIITSGGFDPVAERSELDQDELAAAQELVKSLEKNDKKALRSLVARYKGLAEKKNENNRNSYIAWLLNQLTNDDRPALSGVEAAAYKYFTANACKLLKYFLMYSYRFGNMETVDPHAVELNLAAMGTLMELGPANRRNITDVDRVMELMALKSGQAVCDIGFGAATFTELFAKAVGSDGRVYALDINHQLVRFLQDYISDNDIENVFALLSKETKLGLPKNSCDVAFMSSVFGPIYVFYKDQNRLIFLKGLRKVLKNGGRLVIVENYPVGLKDRHFFGKYTLAPEVLIGQLAFFGFELVRNEDIGKGQYYLEFVCKKCDDETVPFPAVTSSAEEEEKRMMANPTEVRIGMADTLLHIMGADTFDLMPRGIEAADLAFKAFKEKNKECADRAIAIYDELIPVENFGGEYTALRLLLKYEFSNEAERKALNADAFADSYLKYMLADNYKNVMTYLNLKYMLTKKSKEDMQKNRILKDFLEDFVLLNNPCRREWEQTAKYAAEVGLKPGQTVADIGCGPGYYSFILSKKVGPSGKVLALDLKKGHLDFIDAYVKTNGITNITTINNEIDSLTLPENSVDAAFICSLYHVLYSENLKERDAFLADIKKVVRPGGRFFVIDNSPMDGDLQYHSNYIDKQLIVAQLHYYGFKLKKYRQFIPQRFLLEFENNK